MDLSTTFFLVKQKCKEFLVFNSSEVRFLVGSSSFNKSLTKATVEHLWDSSFSWKLFLIVFCHKYAD